jgi:hypothetical protein
VGSFPEGRVADDVTKVVLLPRFSSFVGASTFNTPPMSVGEYASANVNAWRANLFGGSPTFQVVVQQSLDLSTWYNLATISPSANAEAAAAVTLTMAWLRLSVTLGGTTPSVTCWVVGDFLKRAA